MPAPIFDSPQWTFCTPADYMDAAHPAIVQVEISPENRKSRTVPVVLPSALFKFAAEVLAVTDANELGYYLDEDSANKRWYLGLTYGDLEYDLWYYTPSNLPYWAK